MDRRDRERIAAEMSVNGGDVVAQLCSELAAAVRDAGELRELLTGAAQELAGNRGELDELRAELATLRERDRAQLAQLAQQHTELQALRETQLERAVNGTDIRPPIDPAADAGDGRARRKRSR
jgi:hypothetical protein